MKKIYIARRSGYGHDYSAAFMSKKNAEVAVKALGGDYYGIIGIPVLDAPVNIKGALGTALELDEWEEGDGDAV